MTTETMPTEEMVQEALKEVIDPEIGINVVDLGLVYGVQVDDGTVGITMTLTTPMCPLSEYVESAVREAVEPLPGVSAIDFQLVWTPPWDISMLSEDGKLELGYW
jgi:metal-sulfur cluster biosynthetic enzyme